MKTREELIKHCQKKIKTYQEFIDHDYSIKNFQEASEDLGRIKAYEDVLIQLQVKL